MLLVEREADSERTQADIGVPLFFRRSPLGGPPAVCKATLSGS